MKQYRLAFIILVLAALCSTVKAQDLTDRQAELWGAEVLERQLPDGAEQLMDEYGLYDAPNLFQAMITMARDALQENESTIRSGFSAMARILVIIILCRLADVSCDNKVSHAATVTGTLAVIAVCASDLKTMIGLGKETMNEISDYSSLLLPVMVSAAMASGSLTGASMIYTIAAVFSNLLIRFCKGVLIPAIYAYLSLAVTDTIIQQERLKKIREFVGWCIEKGLKAVTYLFVGFLSITGMLTSSADTAALKAAKATISGAVPVVGGIISGAADTVFSSAVFLKNSIGTFGMLAIFATFIIPFFNMGISYLMFKISAALGGLFGSGLSSLLEAIGTVMGYLLAMVACCVLISVLSCGYLVKTVHI